MAGATGRLAPLFLLCLTLAGGSHGQESSGQRAAAAAAVPGLACSALVDTDAPELWQAVGDVPSARLAAHTLLLQHYGQIGGPAACGPLVSSPDTDILILGACSKDELTALLFYARFVCTKKACAGGKPCIYGAKLLGTARKLPNTEPRVTQLDVVSAAPSVTPNGTGVVQRAGGRYIRANFKQTQFTALPYKDLLAKGSGGPVRVHLKSGTLWRVVSPNPASFGSGYPRLPPPSKAPAAASSGAQAATLPTCVEITGVAGFEEVARAAPPSLFAESAQAAFLAYFSTVNKTAATACPRSQADGKVRLGAVTVDAMWVCRKATANGVAYGLRFTAYFPCVVGQGRFAVLDATAVQPGPTHEAAFGPTQVLSMPPNSTAGIGWGANVGISDRTRLFAKFTRVSSIQALDVAVDPGDPSNIWIVGPEDPFTVNPACDKPYGGALLKWSWAASSFRPVAGVTAAGMRVTVMPGHKKPWIVDGCGQLSGWGLDWKRLYGPAPQGQLYDIAATNGTVFSGCASYNPSTFEGDIAAGCSLSVAIGPNRTLYSSDAGDVAVTVDGYQLLANGQDVLYKDPKSDQYFRLYRSPDGYRPLRIAAASNGTIWLVVAAPENVLLSPHSNQLAGVYRGFLHKAGQTKPPTWPTTCAQVDPGCANGGCNAGLTRCVRCAPQFVMGKTGKCRPLVCTDVDPNCAECGPGAMCITCRPGFVRGYHSGDTLCRRPIKGFVKCWYNSNGTMLVPSLTLNTSTWQYMVASTDYSSGGLLDSTGKVLRLTGGATVTFRIVLPASNFRQISYHAFHCLGLTSSGALKLFSCYDGTVFPTPSILSKERFLAVAGVADGFSDCLVTKQGDGVCVDYGSLVDRVGRSHAVCLSGSWSCFLSVHGDILCVLRPFYPGTRHSIFVPPPREEERWVEIVCSTSGVCARASSGAVRCFTIPGSNQFKQALQLPGNYSMLASVASEKSQRLCGITATNTLQCAFSWKSGSDEQQKRASIEPATKWAGVFAFSENVCAISFS